MSMYGKDRRHTEYTRGQSVSCIMDSFNFLTNVDISDILEWSYNLKSKIIPAISCNIMDCYKDRGNN